jgi:hypothetical protein
MEKPDTHKFDPALLASTWWTTFNPKGNAATYSSTQDESDLPADVQQAHRTFACDHSQLEPDGVNWNVTCVSKTATRLRKTELLEGASRSGKHCGENDLWAVPTGVNDKGTPTPRGSSAFGYKGIIYIIDGGLCPCLRCCQSLLGLANRTESTIIVRPMVDYELISSSRTPLKGAYLLVFEPATDRFLVYHELAQEAPANASDRDVTRDATRAWFQCSNRSCNLNFTVRFASARQKSSEIRTGAFLGANRQEYPVLNCTVCRNGELVLVTHAKGPFPTREIRLP